MKYHKSLKIKCLNCQKERFAYYADIQRGKGKYCNRQCWDKHKRKIPEVINCKKCNKNFKDIYSQYRKFCSKKCYVESIKGIYPINLKGKIGIKPRTYHLSKRAKHGGAKYKEWRMAVWKRDNFICQFCKKAANQLKKVGIKIVADHIKPYCNYPKLRYEISNGRTLCVSCHKTTETYGSKARYY